MSDNDIEIREMRIEDYDLVIDLWESTEGIGLSKADSRDNLHIMSKLIPE